jgi:threonine aldolase
MSDDRPEVDLRSDTVTRPTAAMREAMAEAEVGNDAWGEDPTTNALQDRCADLFGKEAGLLVPSGTMGNQAAVRAWTAGTRSPEVLLHERSHLRVNEAAGVATVSGAQVRPLAGPGGRIPVEDLEEAIQPESPLKAETALVALENTHNYEGGAVLDLDYLAAVRDLCEDRGLPLHVDGARIWNAATALDVPLAEVVAPADSVQFCFSKGLSCPIGSMVVGSEDLIGDVRKVRQYLGGAMRQSGVLSACAHEALDSVWPRLGEDHRRAAELADAVRDLPLGFRDPETNILVMDTTPSGLPPEEVQARCLEEGVGFSVVSETEIRAVLHRGIDDGDVDRAAKALRGALS